MYGWCSSLVHGVVSTKSHPVFIHKPDSSSFPPSLPPSPLPVSPCISISPHFHLLLSPGQQAIQKAVAWQRQAVSCQLSGRDRGRARETKREGRIERGRESFQSVNKALLLPSNQPWPPPPPTSSLFAGKTGWPWKVHSKRAITADYYGVSPAVVIMVIWWEGLHHSKTSLDARAGHRRAFERTWVTSYGCIVNKRILSLQPNRQSKHIVWRRDQPVRSPEEAGAQWDARARAACI